MLSPCSQTTITHGLFLHHLLRLLVQHGEPSLSRHQFVECFAHHFSPSSVPSPLDVARAFARDLLSNLARRHTRCSPHQQA